MTLLIVLMLVLGVVSAASAQEATADLALTKSADRKNVKIGEYISSSCDQGIAYWGLCRVDSLAIGESATITLVTTPITNPANSERKFTNVAYIAESTTFDPNPDNNTASLNLHIVGNTN